MYYTVKFSCGHTQSVDIVGKGEKRERTIFGYENYGICDKCREEAKQKASMEAAEFAKANHWAKLEGTEKQIAYAEVMRKKAYEKALERIEISIKRLPELTNTPEEAKELVRSVPLRLDYYMRTETNSRQWISFGKAEAGELPKYLLTLDIEKMQ